MRATALAALCLLILAGAAGPSAAQSGQTSEGADAVTALERHPGITWRAVAFAPDGSHALIVGEHVEDNRTRDVIARWTPQDGATMVLNQSGPGLVDVDFAEDGDSLVVGLRNEVLLGQPGAYRNVWNDSRFARASADLVFYGLGGAFEPGERNAVVTGSSLLRMAPNGSLDTLHGGQGAFFRSIAWNPQAPYALVEAAVQDEGRTVFGTVWRTDGASELESPEDNVAIYGRQNPTRALLNSIAFAPNGSFALLSGRDGAGASMFTWSANRVTDHAHEGRQTPHDHRWRYQPTTKQAGPVTCIDWHPTGRYAITTGLRSDVVGLAGTRSWLPLASQGPDLFGCAMHPSGSYGLAVGENGTIWHVEHQDRPAATVVHPGEGTLVTPQAETRFLVDVIDRAGTGNVEVTAQVDGNGTVHEALIDQPWWRLDVNTSDLTDGRHTLDVTVRSDAGHFTFEHAFLVNNERFTPTAPTLSGVAGLEGQGSDADGVFTIHWEPLDAPVVYEVRQERTGEGANATRILHAGDATNLTVRVNQDGTYAYSVRAVNAYNESSWSEATLVNVVLDSDGDGVPDERDPQPHFPNQWGDPDGDGITTDTELKQCSDPEDRNSTPATDDDGDGVPNGRECLMGTDPLDPNDPAPQDDGTGNETNTTDGNGTDGRFLPGPGLLALFAVSAASLLLGRRRLAA